MNLQSGNQRRGAAGEERPRAGGGLRGLLDALADPVLTLDPSGRVADLNPAALRLFGGRPGDVRGRHIDELARAGDGRGPALELESLHPGQTARMQVEVAAGRSRRPAELSVMMLPASAGPDPFIVVLRATGSPDGAPAAAVDHVRLLELSHDAFLVRRLRDNRITFWSPSATRMYGWTAEEAVGRTSDQLLQSRLPASPESVLEELRRTGRWEGRLRRRRRSGLEAVIDSRWALLADPTGGQVLEVDHDVTGRVTVEIALREAEQHLRSVFDHCPIGICTVSMDGRILTANPALARMLQLDLARVTRPAFRELVHPQDVPAIQAMFHRVVDGDERIAVERRFRREDGSTFWGRLTASSVTDGIGTLQFCVAVLEDVDDRRSVDAAMEEVNARLDALNRAKSALVSGVSHEFRTALTGIEGFSELLRDRDLEPREVRELAADINSEARRLARMIDDLLDLDRMETGGARLRLQPVDVNLLLTSLVERVRRSAPERRVTLELAADLPTIEADADRLTQVFANLFSNALKYSPPDSPIEVTSARTADGFRATIRDHGPGIPEASLEAVFDRYTRLESQARAGVTGTGLGLPIARQIVSLHGGRVWAESAAGGGAALAVELPLAVPEENRDAAAGL